MEQKTVKIDSTDITARLFGSYDVNTRAIEKAFSVTVRNRSGDEGDAVTVSGEDRESVMMAAEAVKYLTDMAKYNDELRVLGLQVILFYLSLTYSKLPTP